MRYGWKGCGTFSEVLGFVVIVEAMGEGKCRAHSPPCKEACPSEMPWAFMPHMKATWLARIEIQVSEPCRGVSTRLARTDPTSHGHALELSRSQVRRPRHSQRS